MTQDYIVVEDANYSNRLLPAPYTNFINATEGEIYDFEMVAKIRNDDGTEKYVFWIFEAIKGQEPELDSYDYSIGNAYSIIDA